MFHTSRARCQPLSDSAVFAAIDRGLVFSIVVMRDRARVMVVGALLLAPGCDAVQGIAGGKSAEGEVAKAEAEAAKAKAEAEKAKAEAETAKAKAEAAKAKAEAAAASAKSDTASSSAAPAAVAAPTAAAAATAAAPTAAAPTAAADASATATPSTSATPTPAAGLAATAPASGSPCIVGTWDAVDYRAAIERAIYRDPELRRLKYASTGGTLGYIVEPPTDNKGTVRQVAEGVTYRFGGNVSGYDVTLTIKLDGENVADYQLSGADKIVIADPTKKAMKVNAHVNVKGLAKMSKSKKVDLDFDGTFTYACKDDALEVTSADEKGRPLSFKRSKQG
jgi:hypothetical protein